MTKAEMLKASACTLLRRDQEMLNAKVGGSGGLNREGRKARSSWKRRKGRGVTDF